MSSGPAACERDPPSCNPMTCDIVCTREHCVSCGKAILPHQESVPVYLAMFNKGKPIALGTKPTIAHKDCALREVDRARDYLPFRGLIPQVPYMIGPGKMVAMPITQCDWDGKTLLDEKGQFKWSEVQIEDDAIRGMYFCSKECQEAFNAKYPKEQHCWPGIKLKPEGHFVRLKDYESETT